MNWSRPQRRHMQWLALPRSQRQPRFKSEWALLLGRSRRTLQRWERLPGFMDTVWELSQASVADKLPDIMDALVLKAQQGNTAAARLVLETAGRIAPSGGPRASVQVANFYLTPAHLNRILAELTAWERQHET